MTIEIEKSSECVFNDLDTECKCMHHEVIKVNNSVFYRWLNIDGSGEKPKLTSETGIEVDIKRHDNSLIIKKKIKKAIKDKS